MRSHVTADFRSLFANLPRHVQRLARNNYRIWKDDPFHPGLQFKLVSKRSPVYAVRVGIGWRALGVKKDDVIIWFWIGSHADYDRMLRAL